MYSCQTRARPGTDQPRGRRPVGLQVGDPVAQGERVVLADRLHVAHLEPGALQLCDGGADRGQFAVGEDVGVDELVHVVGGLVAPGAAGDLVVQQPSARLEEPEQVGGVLQIPLGTDVLGHTDGRDGVVRPVRDVPVVLDADLHPVGEPLVGDALAGERGLLLGERDADDAHAVLAGRVDRHGTPAGADVEKALTWGQAQLAADQFELVALGVLQGAAIGREGRPVGTGVDHGRAEDQLVEVVADVVVVADGASVAALGVQVAAGPADLLRRRGGRQRRPGEPDQTAYGGPDLGVAERLDETAGVLVALPDETGEETEGGVEVAVHVEVPGHPGPGQAQFARLEQQAAQGPAVADDEGRRARRTRLRTVPGADAHREWCSQQLFEEVLQPQRGVSHGVPP